MQQRNVKLSTVTTLLSCVNITKYVLIARQGIDIDKMRTTMNLFEWNAEQ